MRVSRSRRRQLGAIGLAALVATAGSAYAASNTVASRTAGQGVSTVAGFTVVDLGYVPYSDPEYITQVTFTITRDLNTLPVDSTNADVSISLDDGTNYYSCLVNSGTATCDITTPMEFVEVESVSVVAYDLNGTSS